MRNLKVLVTGLALAGLAGCGTAYASESRPSWVAPSASSAGQDSSDGGPAAESSSTGDPDDSTAEESTSEDAPDEGVAEQEDAQENEQEAPGQDSPGAAEPSAPEETEAPSASPSKPSAPSAHHGGPANSLMKTGDSGVALTFDDGPDPEQTPKLLDLLAQEGVKATFCLVGQQAQAHPDLVRRIVDEGHTLCNHTWEHSLTLGKASPDEIRRDLEKTNDAIHAAVPDAEIKYMRAPGGNFTPAFVKTATELGMTSIYWQVDTRDWEHPSGESADAHVDRVITTVKKEVGEGAIVLSHDFGQPGTITAYKTLLPWLKERYTLIALS